MIIFKIKVKSYRENKGLTQHKLAELSGVSQSYIDEIENDLKTPSLPTLEKLSIALEVCLNMLIVPDNPDCKSCIRRF